MQAHHRRTSAIVTTALLMAGLAVPTASALAPDLTASGVGGFLVDANGLAAGQHVTSAIDEGNGLLANYEVTGLAGGTHATTVFDAIQITDFQQTQKIQGVGSAALALEGSNAHVQAADIAGGLLAITARDATTVSYRLPSGIEAHAAHDGIGPVTLSQRGGPDLGHLHIRATSADSTSALRTEGDQVVATLDAGDSVLFRGIAGHLRSLESRAGIKDLAPGAQSHLDALHALAGRGQLVAENVVDFDGSRIHDAAIVHSTGGALTSRLAGQNALVTDLFAHPDQLVASAAGASSAVIRHDLDYEVLPVQQAEHVAVYVNGQLVDRTASASALTRAASADLDAAHVLTTGGRTHVLTALSSASQATGALGVGGTSTIHIVDVTHFAGNPPALAQQAISTTPTDVVGHFTTLGDLDRIGATAAGTTDAQAKFIGRFASGIISKDVAGATVIDYADVETRTQVFDQVTVVGERLVGGQRISDGIVQVTGPATTLTAHDDVWSTTQLDVHSLSNGVATQEVAFSLAEGVNAHLVTDRLATLHSNSGYIGHLAIVGAATATADAPARLVLGGTTAAGSADLVAHVPQDAQLLLLSEELRSSHGQLDAILRGATHGKVAGHALVGSAGQAVHATSAAYLAGADLGITSAQRGALALTHHAGALAPDATSFIVDARGTALLAPSPDHLSVLVDGAHAVQMTDVRSVLEAGFPAYMVDTSSADTVLVLVNAASQARAPGGADIQILSEHAAAARADAASDLFGRFDVRADGTAMGHYVQARTDALAGTVQDVIVTAPQGATVVFEAVRIGDGSFASPGASGTAALTLAKRDATVTLTDQTAAVLTLATEAPAEAELVLADGITVSKIHDAAMLLEGPNGLMGALVVTDVAGRAVPSGSLDLQLASGAPGAGHGRVVAALAEGSQVLFKSFGGVETELIAAERLALTEALAAGGIAGQVVVQSAGAVTPVLSDGFRTAASFAAGGGQVPGGAAILHETTSFSSTMDLTTAATTQEVTVTLSSAMEAGKTLLISLDAHTIPGLASGEAEVLFDGTPIGPASSYADVLDPSNDAGVAEYHIITSSVSGASQVLVSVPHFSTHTVTLREASGSSGDVFLWLSVGLALVVVIETVYLVRRRSAY